MENEIWKDIQGFPLYRVSNHGRILSLGRTYTRPNWKDGKENVVRLRDRIINGCIKKLGDRPVVKTASLRADNKTHHVRVSHLVLEAFVGPRPIGMEACHNDGNPANNRIENLRWDTHAANMADQVQHGTKSSPPTFYGENHPMARLTDAQVEAIRAQAMRRGLRAELAREHGVSATSIGRILSGKQRV